MNKTLLASLLSVLLAGCGGGESDAGDTTPPELRFETRVSIDEPAETTTIDIPVKFTKAAVSDGQFSYSISAETATSEDVKLASDVVTFKAGDRSASIPIVVMGDQLVEEDETIVVTIGSGQNITLDNTTMTVTIEEQHALPVPTMESRVTVKESASEPKVRVRFDGQAPFDGSVTVAISHTGTTDSDVSTESETINFKAGDSDLYISLVISQDGLFETDESFTLSLTDVVNLDATTLPSTDVTIENSDDEPEIGFPEASSFVVQEGASQVLTVTTSIPSSTDISIGLSSEGIANYSDFSVSADNEVVIPAGEAEATFTVTVTDDNIPEGGESVTFSLDTVSVGTWGKHRQASLIIPGTLSLNDSGITDFSHTGGTFDTTPHPNLLGQDGETGRDVTTPSNSDGHAGRSYTKLDSAGNALSAGSNDWQCIRDNITGIAWERKGEGGATLPDSSLTGTNLRTHLNSYFLNTATEAYPYTDSHQNFNAANYRYYWYNRDSYTNGGNNGTLGESLYSRLPIDSNCAFPHDHDSLPGGTYPYNNQARECATETYTDYLNAISYCGYRNWSLPDIGDLRSIHIYQQGGRNIGAPAFFDRTDSTANYLSATPSPTSSGATFCLNGGTGEVKLCNKNSPNAIRARAGE
ncbi:Calx-beta domain-containing protein [uncultured Photobacterium sp.]|uniref:Calx-beta domain-containing protein n=1 Tax=uncultured Photobacterium sp. TaxID=173973 RepID=UPI00262E0F67|nr:Calx-beta domain-containing protein [uncultured Photobacterium sp.]